MSTYAEELKVPKDIDIKLYRLTPPSLDTINIPLSGLYNPIDNIESSYYSLNNKLKNFDISSNKCVNIENLLGFNTVFGRTYTNEYLELIICLLNISDHEVSVDCSKYFFLFALSSFFTVTFKSFTITS